jgi:hypothetical protein
MLEMFTCTAQLTVQLDGYWMCKRVPCFHTTWRCITVVTKLWCLTLFFKPGHPGWIEKSNWNTIFGTWKGTVFEWLKSSCIFSIIKDRIRSINITYQFSLSRYSIQNTESELLYCQFLFFIMSQLAVKLKDEDSTPISPNFTPISINCVWPFTTTCCNGDLLNWEETRSWNTGNEEAP